MIFIIKYFLIKPIIYLIKIIDLFIFTIRGRGDRYSHLPVKPPYSKLIHQDNISRTYRSIYADKLFRIPDANLNIYKEFVKTVQKYKTKKTFGVRKILEISDEVQQNGKTFRKFKLDSEYKWSTYEDILEKVDSFAQGLLEIGLKSNDCVIIYSETRAEWLMSALACFKIKAVVVTLYATLGLDALAYGINETNAKVILTSGECVQKLNKINEKIPGIKNIVVFTDKFTENLAPLRLQFPNFKFNSFNELIEIAKKSSHKEYESPKFDDLAIIMYTSGTTGTPKGVMITHRNLLTPTTPIVARLGKLDPDDIYISYLPLAHIFELLCELTFLNAGCKIGYSNPLTLSDASTGIRTGDNGDLKILKPTLITCVPTVLERMSKAVNDKISKETPLKKFLLETAADCKLSLLRKNINPTLLNKLVFNKLNKALFGGRLRGIIAGGAVLNRELQEFCQIYFSPCYQVYGLTETCGGGTTQFGFDTEPERIGSLIPACQIRLVNWDEGNYRVTDKPNPRGEIWIGGDSITQGYYKLPEKTEEDYHLIDGVRYFSTGDVGEIFSDGTLKIIDRKKDLVKLKTGEYVSLNKVESVLKLLPFVSNCCIIVDQKKSNCICLISPDIRKLEEFLNGQNESKRRSSLDIQNNVFGILEKNYEKFNQDIIKHCKQHGLETFEIPNKTRIIKEIWLPDTGLVTDSLKLKRKEIERFYELDIKKLQS